MKRHALVALVALLPWYVACDSDSGTGPDLVPAGVTVVSGAGSTAGVAMEVAVSVKVTNAAGQGLEGVPVDWGVVSGGGTLQPTSSRSNAAGVAASSWTLGPAAGEQAARATVSGVPAASFTAVAEPGEAVWLVLDADSTLLESLGANALLRVSEARDEYDNRIEDPVVVWSSTAEEVASVDTEGLVTARAEGTALITASAGAATDSAVVVVKQRAVALGFRTHPADRLAHHPSPTAVEVVVEDAGGHPVASASHPVVLTLTPAGTLDGATSVAPEGGVARFADLAVGEAGRGYRVRAQSGELPVATSDFFDVHLAFASVSAGHVHTCGRSAEGAVHCWGENSTGRVGDGSSVNRDVPVPVASVERFASVEAGAPASWALNGAGQAFGWGQELATSPVAVAGPEPYVSITTRWHTCALTAAGLAYCWGTAPAAFGSPGSEPVSEPTVAMGEATIRQITTGGYFTCAIHDDGTAWCAGNNPSGELGNGSTDFSSVPTPVLGRMEFATLVAGDEFACGITVEGPTYCWGLNESGQLGSSAAGAFSAEPVPVAGGHQFTALDAGATHVCALTGEGKAYCWGSDPYGALGVADTAAPEPVAVDTPLRFRQISAGGDHTCGVAEDGYTYCWGLGAHGQLGDGSLIGGPVPRRIAAPWI